MNLDPYILQQLGASPQMTQNITGLSPTGPYASGYANPMEALGGQMPQPQMPQQAAPQGGGMDWMNPMLGAGLGLLSAGYDHRVNPFQAALGGMTSMQAMRNRTDLTKARTEEFKMEREAQENERKQREANARLGREYIKVLENRFSRKESEGGEAITPNEMAQLQAANYAAATGDNNTLGELLKPQEPQKITPYTDAGKAAQDLARGLITPEQYRTIVSPPPTRDADVLKLERSLRNDLNKLEAPYETSFRNASKAMAALNQGTGAGDYAALIGFIKTLDPESVVREGEVAMFEAVQPYWKQLQQKSQRLQDSGYLTPELRNEMRQMISAMTGIYKTDYVALREEYSDLMEGETSINPAKVLGEAYAIPDYDSPGEIWKGPASEAPLGARMQDADGNMRVKTKRGWEVQ